MLSRLYAKWMFSWETALTTRDTNRIVRPLEWGFDWLEDFSPLAQQAPLAASTADGFARMIAINNDILARPEEYFGYRTPTAFPLENPPPQPFPPNVRPETLQEDAELKRQAETGELEEADFLRFTSPVRTRYPENDIVNARWYPADPETQKGKPKQAIIVMPQWNADAFSHNALCALFNSFGISALRLSKPYHDIRRPAELERSDYAVSANIGRTISACRQAVVDIRCCLDWLESQGYEQFGVLGTSLGSCYGFLASAHDRRLRVNAFNHASAAVGDVVWAGQSTRHIRQALQEAGLTQDRIRALWSSVSPISYYAKFASEEAGGPDKRVMLVYADYDLTFPREYSLQVVDAFRRYGLNFEPRVLPCGHYTTGETPYKFLDGWYLGWFVYRAFKALRKEKAAEVRGGASRQELEEEAVSR